MNSSVPLAVGMWVLYVVLRSREQLQGDKSLQAARLLRRGSLILSSLSPMFGQWDAEQLQRLSLAGAGKHPGILLGLGSASSRISRAAGHQNDHSTSLCLKGCVSRGCLNAW